MLKLLIAVAVAGGAPDLPGPKWDGRTFRPYADDAAAVGFEVPMSELRVEARHFDVPRKAAHVLSIIGPGGVEVAIDIWNDAREPGAFLDAELPFLKSPGSSTASVVVAKRLPALLIAQPRTPSAPAMRTALFKSGGRIFRVTCARADESRARAVFDHVIDTFEVKR